MKQSPEINVKMSEDLLKKLIYVSKAEGRTPNNHILLLLRNSIQYFERVKGKIPDSALNGIDISEFTNNNN